MTIYAELPDGRRLEFPDGTDPLIVQSVVKRTLKESPVQLTTPIDQLPGKGPTEGMSTLDKARAGMGRSFAELARGGKMLTGQYSTGEYRKDRALDQSLLDDSAGSFGNFAGDVASFFAPGAVLKTAGMLPKLGPVGKVGEELMLPQNFMQGARAGAVAEAIQPTESMGNKPVDMARSAVVGGATAGAPSILRGSQDPVLQRLSKEGVTPTVGQMSGGWLRRLEEGMTSIPLLGDMVKGAQRRGVESVNTAAYNRALTPIGEKMPKGVEGREAVAYVEGKLSDKYNQLLPKLAATIDAQFLTDVNAIRAQAGTLTKEKESQFQKIINSQLMDRFKRASQGGNTMDGTMLTRTESDLGQLVRNYRSSSSADDRVMASLLSDVQGAFKQLILRANPQYGKELKPINEGWANFMRAEKAALTQDGIFTPAQLGRAVKSLDPSRNKGQYAKGDALMQQLSDDAQLFMGNTLPDSGTPFRAFAATGMTGAAGLGGGYLVNPVTGVLAATAPFMYTPAGQRLMVQLAARRPQLLQDLGNVTAKATPYVTAPALAASNK